MKKIILLLALVAGRSFGASETDVGALFTKVIDAEIGKVSGVGSAWGDFDGDGYPDIYIGTTVNNPSNNGVNQLYRNLRNGSFELMADIALPKEGGVMSAGFCDFDNDGFLDLFGTRIAADVLYRNGGSGSFTGVSTALTKDAVAGIGSAWGDVDNDGFVDVFVANEGGNNALFKNDGKGGFVKVSAAGLNVTTYSQACAWADYDNDGWLDLFVASYHGDPNLLYHNDGKGGLTRITTGSLVTQTGTFGAVAWGDYDNDGYFDLFVGSYAPKNFLYRNKGDGTFERMTASIVSNDLSSSGGAAWGDYDNDGYLDLLVNGMRDYQRAFLYHNKGDGTFEKVTAGALVTEVGEGRSCAFVDYDRDGFLDVWLARTFGTRNALYHNNGNTNRWLEVRCEGRVSNRAGIGAKIRVKATIGGRSFWQLRQITGTELTAHFGLGDASAAEVVRVEWPSGIAQEFSGVAAKQFFTVTEPSRVGIRGGGASLELNLDGAKGKIYRMERSGDLMTWESFGKVTNSIGRESMTLSAEAPGVFYRAAEEP